jgi:hypothetical protein
LSTLSSIRAGSLPARIGSPDWAEHVHLKFGLFLVIATNVLDGWLALIPVMIVKLIHDKGFRVCAAILSVQLCIVFIDKSIAVAEAVGTTLVVPGLMSALIVVLQAIITSLAVRRTFSKTAIPASVEPAANLIVVYYAASRLSFILTSPWLI